MLQIVPKLSSIGILYKWFCFQRDFFSTFHGSGSTQYGSGSTFTSDRIRPQEKKQRGSGWTVDLFSFTNKPDGTVTNESRVPVPGSVSEWP